MPRGPCPVFKANIITKEPSVDKSNFPVQMCVLECVEFISPSCPPVTLVIWALRLVDTQRSSKEEQLSCLDP